MEIDIPFPDTLRGVEDALHLRRGFLVQLRDEDDWSFVIKAHAFLEAAVGELLARQVGDQRVEGVFQRLELSNLETGKIAFARAFGLFTPAEVTFIRRFSELRNSVVHRVHNVNFKFVDYLPTLDANQLKAWKRAFSGFAPEPKAQAFWGEQSVSNSKLALWFGVLMLAGRVQRHFFQIDHARTSLTMKLDLFEVMTAVYLRDKPGNGEA